MTVPLLDLTAQYQALHAEIDAAVRRTIESQTFIFGPAVTALEAELASFLGVPHAHLMCVRHGCTAATHRSVGREAGL